MSDVIVSVNGLDIKKNSLYKIVDKADNNALDGLKEYGSTKIPQEYMGTSAQCPWDQQSSTYDTGFYTFSPCYKGLDQEARVKLVNILQDNIVDPYEKVYGHGTLDNKNENFWSNYNIDLEEGRIFNTSNVKDLLDLYISMRGFELTPKALVGDPRFKNSQFFIEDREVSNKKRNERAQNYMSVLQHFFIMLNSEKHKLISVLKYANMNGANSMTIDTPSTNIQALFKDWIDGDVKNVDNFLRISTMINKKAGLEEVTLYSLLLDMNKRNKLPKVGEEFTYDDIPLGADLKSAAKNLATKTNLKSLREKIYQEETEE